MKRISKDQLKDVVVNYKTSKEAELMYETLEDCYCSTDNCVVKGCQNMKWQGKFVGDICSPCYRMITTGEDNPSTNFIHELYMKVKK